MTQPTQDHLDAHWQRLAAILAAEGTPACVAAIARELDDTARHQLFRRAIRELGRGEGGATAAGLDGMLAIGDAAIADALRISAAQPEAAARWIDAANVVAYNLAANLCDCWGDGASRLVRHFEAGLALADRALAWRRQLRKSAGPFAMAHWVRGKHLLSLGRHREAAQAFAESLRCEQELARDQARPEQPGPQAPTSLVAMAAYAAFACLRAGDNCGEELERLRTMLRDQAVLEGEGAEDARIYLDQLQQTSKRN